jgi:hypothetical protein
MQNWEVNNYNHGFAHLVWHPPQQA